MTFDFTEPRGGDADRLARAEQALNHARQIVAGGWAAALAYAEAWYAFHMPRHWAKAGGARRALMAAEMAGEAAKRAAGIVADGRAHYWHSYQPHEGGGRMLCVASLIGSGEEQPLGYVPWRYVADAK